MHSRGCIHITSFNTNKLFIGVGISLGHESQSWLRTNWASHQEVQRSNSLRDSKNIRCYCYLIIVFCLRDSSSLRKLLVKISYATNVFCFSMGNCSLPKMASSQYRHYDCWKHATDIYMQWSYFVDLIMHLRLIRTGKRGKMRWKSNSPSEDYEKSFTKIMHKFLFLTSFLLST